MAVEVDVLPPRYRRPHRIGRGGMGDIYRATDAALGRDVAIKLLGERYAEDDAIRERFTREALAAARLSGRQSVVTIFDVGEWHGRPYIVMEHLAGGSLEARLRSGRVSTGQAVAWLEDAAVALDAAHEEGVVHRDVKPANLLLDRDGRVHVADFGIASAAGMDSLTKTGTVLGTAGYLAPEQARGERATAATDRYALAVVAWELLTGERPFAADTPAAEAAAHVHADVPPISERRRDLPPELDRVFVRALAKDPEERYPCAADFVAEIRGALHRSEGHTAALAPVGGAATRLQRRRPAWLLPALALLALLGAGAALAAVIAANGDGEGAQRTQQPPATTEIVRTVTEQGETVQVTVTAQAQPTTPAAPAPPQTTAPAEGGALSVSQAIALQDQSTAEMNRGNWDQALALAQQALPALQGRDRTYEAYANFNIGNSLANLGRCDEALPYLDRREQLLGSHPAVTQARARCGA